MMVDIALLDDLCDRWVESYKFKFWGDTNKVLTITPEDVGHILNLPCSNGLVELQIRDNHSTFWKRHLKGTSLVR